MADLRLRSTHEIHRTKTPGKAGDRSKGIAPTPPVTEIVKPNTLFNAKNQTQYDELTAGDYPAANPAPVESDDDGPKSLADMSKTELLAFADENGIEVVAKDSKVKLISVIEATQGDTDPDDELV